MTNDLNTNLPLVSASRDPDPRHSLTAVFSRLSGVQLVGPCPGLPGRQGRPLQGSLCSEIPYSLYSAKVPVSQLSGCSANGETPPFKTGFPISLLINTLRNSECPSPLMTGTQRHSDLPASWLECSYFITTAANFLKG